LTCKTKTDRLKIPSFDPRVVEEFIESNAGYIRAYCGVTIEIASLSGGQQQQARVSASSLG
jgi:hypothetical protein